MIQEEVIELQNDSNFKDTFESGVSLEELWCRKAISYPNIREAALRYLMVFSTTFLCEQGFSTLLLIKNKQRNRLVAVHSDYEPHNSSDTSDLNDSVAQEVSLNSPTHCRLANRKRPNINHPEISAAIPNTLRDVPAHPANTSRALNRRKCRRTQCSDLSYGNKIIAPDGTEWTAGAVGDTPAGRRAQQNILRELPRPSGLARQGIDEDKLSSAWLLIIDDRIRNHIEKCTEEEARRRQEVDDWSVSLQELKAFIAILYARGATGAKGLELESL
ncbi:hypothetical protein QE152_g37477 [Popillia japonica]|uniref:Transposase n=1 Tax=Popillia japonica TaxID=7064 RepID=A0AAW1IAG7_POPJA